MAHPDRYLLAGVMGWPVMHSRSPKLHNYWLAQHHLVGAYVPLAIKKDGLEKALRALPALGFSGCNLTIPAQRTGDENRGSCRSGCAAHRRHELRHCRC